MHSKHNFTKFNRKATWTLINADVTCLPGWHLGVVAMAPHKRWPEGRRIHILHLPAISDGTLPTPSSSVKDLPAVCSVNYRSFDVIEHGPVEIDYSLS